MQGRENAICTLILLKSDSILIHSISRILLARVDIKAVLCIKKIRLESLKIMTPTDRVHQDYN